MPSMTSLTLPTSRKLVWLESTQECSGDWFPAPKLPSTPNCSQVLPRYSGLKFTSCDLSELLALGTLNGANQVQTTMNTSHGDLAHTELPL